MYETDEDSDIIAGTEGMNTCISNSKVEVKSKNADEKLRCEQCDFVGKTNVERNKHVNTKHAIKSDEKFMDIEGVEEIEDMFQIEYLEGEQVYACNICDEGFDKEAEVREHIGEVHHEIITQIKESLEEEEQIKVDESDGDSLLSKFGNDGNVIG